MIRTLLAVGGARRSVAFGRARRGAAGGVELGVLDCTIEGGTGFIIGSKKDLRCTFNPARQTFAPETYFGVVRKWGIDIGTTDQARHALAGAGAEQQHLRAGRAGRRLCRRQRRNDRRRSAPAPTCWSAAWAAPSPCSRSACRPRPASTSRSASPASSCAAWIAESGAGRCSTISDSGFAISSRTALLRRGCRCARAGHHRQYGDIVPARPQRRAADTVRCGSAPTSQLLVCRPQRVDEPDPYRLPRERPCRRRSVLQGGAARMAERTMGRPARAGRKR